MGNFSLYFFIIFVLVIIVVALLLRNYALKKTTKKKSYKKMSESPRPLIPSTVKLPSLAEKYNKKAEEDKKQDSAATAPTVETSAQIEQVAPVVQAPPKPTQPVVTAPVVTHQVVAPVVQKVSKNIDNEDLNNVLGDTYLKIVDGDGGGILEFDLVSHRQRGEEKRYLSIRVIGVDEDDSSITNKTLMTISSQATFDTLKEFFTRLDWQS